MKKQNASQKATKEAKTDQTTGSGSGSGGGDGDGDAHASNRENSRIEAERREYQQQDQVQVQVRTRGSHRLLPLAPSFSRCIRLPLSLSLSRRSTASCWTGIGSDPGQLPAVVPHLPHLVPGRLRLAGYQTEGGPLRFFAAKRCENAPTTVTRSVLLSLPRPEQGRRRLQ